MSNYKNKMTPEMLDEILHSEYELFHEDVTRHLTEYMSSHLDNLVKVELYDNSDAEDNSAGEAIILYTFLLDVSDEMYVEEVKELMSKYKYESSIYYSADFRGKTNASYDSYESEFNIKATAVEIRQAEPEPDAELTWMFFEIEVYYEG